MIRLTDKALIHRWKDFGEYSYVDEAKLSNDPTVRERRRAEIENGAPRYWIAFNRKPNKGKRLATCFLRFSDFAEYVGIDVKSTRATKKEIQAWENEALEWLTKNGVIRGRKEK